MNEWIIMIVIKIIMILMTAVVVAVNLWHHRWLIPSWLWIFSVEETAEGKSPLKHDCNSSLFAKVTLNHGRPVPVVLLANKSDQLPSSQLKLDSFCKENGFVGWFETSAKVGEQPRGFHRSPLHLFQGAITWQIQRTVISLVLCDAANVQWSNQTWS